MYDLEVLLAALEVLEQIENNDNTRRNKTPR